MLDSLLAKAFTIFAQVLVKIQPIWDKYKLLIALLVGVILGWFILGWGLFPVPWENATPGHMRADFKSSYLAYVAEEYQRTNDLQLARERLGLNLAKSKYVPWLAKKDTFENDIAFALANADRFKIASRTQALNALQSRVPELLQPAASAETQPQPGGLVRLIGIVLVIVLLAAFVIGLILWLVSRSQRQPEAAGAATATFAPGVGLGVETPLKSFSTPYVLGDDYFDPSFSIEIGNEFLGECGIGISETIGAGEPKKVTAFEAWLFDKSDIRTVTTVLATDYAFHDPELRLKLEPKGEIALMEPGTQITLETTSLRVVATIKDIEYAQGNLPEGSFVKKVDFELTAWVKQGNYTQPSVA